MNLQLPSWIIKSIEESFGVNKSNQYYIKLIMKECINSEEGRVIIERIINREKGGNIEGKAI